MSVSVSSIKNRTGIEIARLVIRTVYITDFKMTLDLALDWLIPRLLLLIGGLVQFGSFYLYVQSPISQFRSSHPSLS